MNILVTGAKGMVGQALVANLKNIRDGKNRTRPALNIEEIYEYDIDSTEAELEEYCQKADFVFNLAGVNRPKDNAEFMQGNFGFGSKLLDTLKKYDNKAPLMLSSSIQATLIGRYGESDYGKSKLAGEELFFQYGEENGVKVAVYRFPNLMGHSRPNYNSADDFTFYAFCRHQDNYDELIDHMQKELSVHGDIRLCAGVHKNVDLKAPADSWFSAAAAACGSSKGAVACIGQRP